MHLSRRHFNGALLALLVSGQGLGVIGIIGIILLIGIVKKNAIMMIDFAIEAEREQGKAPQEAIHQAALLRFRPIMMTTLAALFAAVLKPGSGSNWKRSGGTGIIVPGPVSSSMQNCAISSGQSARIKGSVSTWR